MSAGALAAALLVAAPAAAVAQVGGPAPLPPAEVYASTFGNPLGADGGGITYTLEDPGELLELYWTFDTHARRDGGAPLEYEGFDNVTRAAAWRTAAPIALCGGLHTLRLRVQFQNVDGLPVTPTTAAEAEIAKLSPDHPLLVATGMNTLRAWYRWETEDGRPVADACDGEDAAAAALPGGGPAFFWRRGGR